MIEVTYCYIRKNNTIITDVATFKDVHKALRFIYKCINSSNMTLMSYDCSDGLDQEYLDRRVH